MSKELFEKEGMLDPAYIGDSVYVGHDGHNIVICIHNGGSRVENKIVIEPSVLEALIRYRDRIHAEWAAQAQMEDDLDGT